MKYIEVEYNRALKPLEAILREVKQPGDFFIAGVVEIPMPRVEVEGAGMLSFPINVPQIDGLLSRTRSMFLECPTAATCSVISILNY